MAGDGVVDGDCVVDGVGVAAVRSGDVTEEIRLLSKSGREMFSEWYFLPLIDTF